MSVLDNSNKVNLSWEIRIPYASNLGTLGIVPIANGSYQRRNKPENKEDNISLSYNVIHRRCKDSESRSATKKIIQRSGVEHTSQFLQRVDDSTPQLGQGQREGDRTNFFGEVLLPLFTMSPS